MGWLTSVADWWRWGYQHKVTTAVIHSSAKIGASLVAQIPAGAQAALSVVTHPPTQKIAKHLFRVAVIDLGGLILLTYINEQVQKTCHDYLGDEPDNRWFSTKTALQLGLTSIEIAAQIIYIRNRLKLQAHTILINIDAPALSKADTTSIICAKEQCATMDYLKGSVRDFSTYWATEIALLMAERLPIPGATAMIFLARTHHNGRFIVTVAKSARCYNHQLIYLKEAPETAFALGLGHAISTFFIHATLERLTGLSSFYYPIMQLMLIPQISVASHMKLCDVASTNRMRDPIGLYQEGIDIAVETLVLGIEQQITRRLKAGQLAPGSFSKFLLSLPSSRLSQLMGWIWHQPPMLILLPSLLQNVDNFIQDPIARENWPTFQSNFVSFLKAIESSQKRVVVQVASALPGTSLLIHLYFGIPEALTKLLFKLINDRAFMEGVVKLRYQLENLRLEKSTPVKVNYESLRLNGFIESTVTYPKILPDSSPLTNANDVIRKDPMPSFSNAPESVIRRKASQSEALHHRFFQNVASNEVDSDEIDDDFVHAM